jgi:hypothetical protein
MKMVLLTLKTTVPKNPMGQPLAHVCEVQIKQEQRVPVMLIVLLDAQSMESAA